MKTKPNCSWDVSQEVEEVFRKTNLEPIITDQDIETNAVTYYDDNGEPFDVKPQATETRIIVNFRSYEMENQAQENETEDENPQLEDTEHSKILKAVASAKESAKEWFNNIRKMKTE